MLCNNVHLRHIALWNTVSHTVIYCTLKYLINAVDHPSIACKKKNGLKKIHKYSLCRVNIEVFSYFVGSVVVCYFSLWKSTKVTFRADADWLRCACHSPLTPYPVTWLASAASSCRRAGWRMLCRQNHLRVNDDRIITVVIFRHLLSLVNQSDCVQCVYR